MNDRARIRNIICAILCIILAAGLGYLIYTDRQQDKEQAVAVEALQAEAKEYEDELEDLRSELSSLESSFSYSSEEAEIMAGFNITDASDFLYIEEMETTYNFSPVLVIDCTMDMMDIEDIITTADADWEIMLYASQFSEKTNEDVLSVISYLESAEREHTGIFFLRDAYNSAANIQLLLEDGFIGYTSYHDEVLAAGQKEDGSVYFEYHFLTEEGTNIYERLSYLYSSKTSMIVILDMTGINSGSLSESYVKSLMKTMRDYADKDDCSFSTVADVADELSEINAIEAENQEEYEKQAAEIQERIDELQEIIDGIYGN